MKVLPIAGEPTRFHVAGSKPRTWYLVDIAASNGNGWCGCVHFDVRLARMARVRKPGEPPARCKHIDAARTHCLDAIIKAWNKTQQKQA